MKNKNVKKFENFNENFIINNKLKLYKELLLLFINKLPSDKIIIDYLTEDDHLELQDWIGMNLKIDWMTSISVIESCDLILNEARTNDILKSDFTKK